MAQETFSTSLGPPFCCCWTLPVVVVGPMWQVSGRPAGGDGGGSGDAAAAGLVCS